MHSALDLDPAEQSDGEPAGQRQLGDLTVTWNSEPVEPPKPGVDQSGTPMSSWSACTTCRCRVTRGGDRLHAFHVRQVGWRQVREVGDLWRARHPLHRRARGRGTGFTLMEMLVT